MKHVKSLPLFAVWEIGVLVAAIFVIPLVWFIFHTLFWTLQPISVGVATDMGTNTVEYFQVDTFFQFIDNWAHVIGFLCVGVFCLFYSQKRGRSV